MHLTGEARLTWSFSLILFLVSSSVNAKLGLKKRHYRFCSPFYFFNFASRFFYCASPFSITIYRYLGDGPKLVRELFRVADEMSPTLVFIDEIDAVGSKRYDSNSGGTREIQRTMLELLNQLDGFDERGDVKVCVYVCVIFFLHVSLVA